MKDKEVISQESLNEDDDADFNIHPISLEDINTRSKDNLNNSLQYNAVNTTAAAALSGKERRRRISLMNRNRRHWQEAFQKARSMSDPWEKFHLDDYPIELAKRFRYHALKKTWVEDEVLVKMEPEPFNHGAMRECFRMRKLNPHPMHSNTWKTVANYVAKQYMDEVEKDVYFEDVKLQMDAKLWGEEFNRHNPPKKVDIFQVSILQFVNRPGQPYFHVEHYIEGHYIKYNSNSGFVSDEALRLTPQAFSHFTFERSGHELIVVDIQGVGDLYTDPQIHTVQGSEYGDGNLGTRGMALFFHSHTCNSICESLGLSKFDLADLEVAKLKQNAMDLEKFAATQIRGKEELCISPSQYERTHWHEFLRVRSLSGNFSPSKTDSPPESPVRLQSFSSISESSEDGFHSDNDSGIGSEKRDRRRRRRRMDSSSLSEENDGIEFSKLIARKSRPSSVQHEIEMRKVLQDGPQISCESVLGQIHLDLAKYHEAGRFLTQVDTEYDKEAALFHLQHAADCGNLEAIITLSRLHLNLTHDILVDIELPNTDDNIAKGMDFLLMAATRGDRASMISVAKAFDTGFNLGIERSKSWKEAIYWYDKAACMEDLDDSGHFDGCLDDPNYLILARQAEMYQTGGFGLPQDLNQSGELYQAAADSAMAAMKGRLANKYYQLAEEVWASMEE